MSASENLLPAFPRNSDSTTCAGMLGGSGVLSQRVIWFFSGGPYFCPNSKGDSLSNGTGSSASMLERRISISRVREEEIN